MDNNEDLSFLNQNNNNELFKQIDEQLKEQEKEQEVEDLKAEQLTVLQKIFFNGHVFLVFIFLLLAVFFFWFLKNPIYRK